MFEELKELICEYVDVNPSDIKEESRFIEDLGFNSYDFMSMWVKSRRNLMWKWKSVKWSM